MTTSVVPATFSNRLTKKWRTLRPWAAREGLTAFRVYDQEIPEYPLAVDLYGEQIQVSEFPSRRARREGSGPLREVVCAAIEQVLSVPAARIHWKTHVPQVPGGAPFRPHRPSVECVVEENGLRFWVNLTDFWDTGLFLDHRRTRARVRREVAGTRFLNLFGYTGSFTVYAAAGGARETTTVDLSPTYLAWAERNLTLNHLAGPAHQRIRADVLQWIASAQKNGQRYDCIVLDPPSFSRSKAMHRTFEVQRDHPALLSEVAGLLAPGGVLYFSTNLHGFEPRLPKTLRSEELTPGSLPRDFEQRDVHRAWRLSGAPVD